MCRGMDKSINRIPDLSLHKAFTIFKEYRMRLGIDKFVNCVSDLSLHSAFTIFAGRSAKDRPRKPSGVRNEPTH